MEAYIYFIIIPYTGLESELINTNHQCCTRHSNFPLHSTCDENGTALFLVRLHLFLLKHHCMNKLSIGCQLKRVVCSEPQTFIELSKIIRSTKFFLMFTMSNMIRIFLRIV